MWQHKFHSYCLVQKSKYCVERLPDLVCVFDFLFGTTLSLSTDLQSVGSANREWMRSSGMYLKRVALLGRFRDTSTILARSGM